MIGQMLGILKIIGCGLAVLILLVLLLLVLILLVPVHYRMEGSLFPKETEPQENRFSFRISFHWLFYLIRGGISFPGETAFTIRLAFWTLLPGKDKKSGQKAGGVKKKKPDKADKKEEKVAISADLPEKKDADGANFADLPEKKDADKEKSADRSEKKDAEDTIDSSARAKWQEAEQIDGEVEVTPSSLVDFSQEDRGKASFFQRLHERIRFLYVFGTKIWAFLKRPYQVFRRAGYTIYSMYVRISMFKALLESDAFAAAFRIALKKMGIVIRSLLPKSGKADLTIGLDNPADTASVLALYGILFPFLPPGVKIFADFENPIFAGDFSFHGRVTLFCIMRCALALWLDRNVRIVVRRFRRIISRQRR